MTSRFAYFYLMKEEPDRIRATAPQHVSHWQGLSLPAYLGGPFQDRSGGLITFGVEDRERAQLAVDADPFVRGGLLAAYWLKEWSPE